MLRTNLSTRPFYNERAVHVVVGLAALLVLALTVLNLVRVVSLSRHNTELASRTGSEQAEAARLTREAAAVRKTMNRDELNAVVAAAQEANALIDQRTFSWTAFFNRIEGTLPPDVMLTSVRPTVKDGETRVAMTLLARRAEDVEELMRKLEATGAFDEVLASQTEITEAGLHRVLVNSVYIPPAAGPEAAAVPAAGTAPGSAKPAAPGGRR